jgi:hypothetical protein
MTWGRRVGARALAGAAAFTGGLCWLVKAAAILVSGWQPPLIFEAAPIFFAVALVGLWTRLDERSGWLERVGLWLAWASGIAAVLEVAAYLLVPQLIPHQSSVTPLTPIIMLAGMGSLLALFALGIATWRTHRLPSPWHRLPALMAIGFPLLSVFTVVAAANLGLAPANATRAIEIPIALLGLAWMGLGLILIRGPKN